jgi:hypothetical protein
LNNKLLTGIKFQLNIGYFVHSLILFQYAASLIDEHDCTAEQQQYPDDAQNATMK